MTVKEQMTTETRLRAALTNTEEAAAGWQKVPETYRERYKRALLAAAPQAGETRKLDRVSPETHPSSWNQRSGFKKTTKAGASEPEGEAGEEG